MDSANTPKLLASGRAEEKNLDPGDGAGPSRPSSMSHAHSRSDETTFSLSKQENGAGSARHATDSPRVYAPEPLEGQEAGPSTTTSQEFELFREGIARLEKAITDLKPTSINDPTTNFWTVYKKVADEHDNDLLKKYTGDLDTSLLFAGLFSAVSTTFIVQIIPSLQPNPSDITNSLLLHILHHNESFGGLDPLQPTMKVPLSVVSAQGLLFASLSVTLFVAFLAVLGKQWILYYTQASTLGSIVERGKERQHKFVGLRKWKLHLVMEALPVLLQISLLLFTIGLIVYLWDIDVSAAGVILTVTCIGFMVYTFITVAATFWSNCPFQTPLSVVLRRVMPRVRDLVALPASGVSLKQGFSPLTVWINNGRGHLANFIKHLRKDHPTSGIPLDQDYKSVYNKRYKMALSNPIFWRSDPLFTSPLENDTAAFAGFWLLETSTDFSAATAVAAVFSEFQWPSDHHSKTALIRLRDTYTECFRAPKFDNSTRLQALQSAAAYYILYHSWLIWSTSKTHDAEVEKLPADLPPDLLLRDDNNIWDGDDLFEYLLHVENRSELVESARFLSYIAPYWFCGDSDSALKFRSKRLLTLPELINVLEASKALDSATFTDCVLCVGAAMDLPLHPEDLIRANKSDYLTQTFQMVVEHIHRIDLRHSRRYHHTTEALKILLGLFKLKPLPLVNATWITKLLRDAAVGGMSDQNFILFLRLSAGRKEEDPTVNAETGDFDLVQDHHAYPPFPGRTVTPGTPDPDHNLFKKIMKNVQKRVTQDEGWQDEAVYGGLISMRDIHLVDPSLFDSSVLQTMHDAMDTGKPFPVRKAAYDVMFDTRNLWLKSGILRQNLQTLGFFKRLHSVVVETARSDYHLSFLMMVEILSEDEYWHPHLREIMEVWLHPRHAGQEYTLLILARVGNFSFSERSTYNTTLDDLLRQLIAEEWEAVPGRPVEDLTVDRLEPLVEVTEQFKELLFEDFDRRTVLGVVRQVIPTLERRRDIGDDGPGEDIRGLINDLLGKLQIPRSQPSRLLSSDE